MPGGKGGHQVQPPGGAWPGVCRGGCCVWSSGCAPLHGEVVCARCSGPQGKSGFRSRGGAGVNGAPKNWAVWERGSLDRTIDQLL